MHASTVPILAISQVMNFWFQNSLALVKHAALSGHIGQNLSSWSGGFPLFMTNSYLFSLLLFSLIVLDLITVVLLRCPSFCPECPCLEPGWSCFEPCCSSIGFRWYCCWSCLLCFSSLLTSCIIGMGISNFPTLGTTKKPLWGSTIHMLTDMREMKAMDNITEFLAIISFSALITLAQESAKNEKPIIIEVRPIIPVWWKHLQQF